MILQKTVCMEDSITALLLILRKDSPDIPACQSRDGNLFVFRFVTGLDGDPVFAYIKQGGQETDARFIGAALNGRRCDTNFKGIPLKARQLAFR